MIVVSILIDLTLYMVSRNIKKYVDKMMQKFENSTNQSSECHLFLQMTVNLKKS